MSDNYQHRDVDEDGNPDDLFTEAEAIEMAREAGLDYIDTYKLMPASGVGPALTGDEGTTRAPLIFETAEEAEKHRADLKDADDWVVSQERHMVPAEDQQLPNGDQVSVGKSGSDSVAE